LLIDGDTIVSVGDTADKTDLVIDGRRKAVIPGLMNCHTHAAMTLFRSYADDMKLHEWLETKIWPLEAKLDGEAVYWGTKLACLEMLKSGTTFFADMYFYCEDIARAVSDMGIRACISSAFFDFFDPGILEENMKRVEKELSTLEKYEMVIPSVGPHAVYTVSLEGLKRAAELANERNIPVHFHLAETEREVLDFRKKHGKGIIQVLDEIGFLSPRLIAAHSVWLDDSEIQLLAKRGVNAVHCPASNMKLCVGKAINFTAMKEAGLNVCLGTDGAASNNNLDILEEMKFAALLQKFFYNDPTLMKADEVFAMATVNAARAFRLRAGMIKEGYLADLVIVDLRKSFMSPDHSLVSNLVYSASSECVDTVIVGGKIIVQNGVFPDEERIIEKASKVAFNLVQG
jgi:5-methylthioadenosine/S-adenosylhomocysteine deaminase